MRERLPAHTRRAGEEIGVTERPRRQRVPQRGDGGGIAPDRPARYPLHRGGRRRRAHRLCRSRRFTFAIPLAGTSGERSRASSAGSGGALRRRPLPDGARRLLRSGRAAAGQPLPLRARVDHLLRRGRAGGRPRGATTGGRRLRLDRAARVDVPLVRRTARGDQEVRDLLPRLGRQHNRHTARVRLHPAEQIGQFDGGRVRLGIGAQDEARRDEDDQAIHRHIGRPAAFRRLCGQRFEQRLAIQPVLGRRLAELRPAHAEEAPEHALAGLAVFRAAHLDAPDRLLRRHDDEARLVDEDMIERAATDAGVVDQRVAVRQAAQFLIDQLVVADFASPLRDALQAGLEEDEADDDERIGDEQEGDIEEGDRRANEKEEDTGEELEAARPLIHLHLFEIPRDEHRGTSLSGCPSFPKSAHARHRGTEPAQCKTCGAISQNGRRTCLSSIRRTRRSMYTSVATHHAEARNSAGIRLPRGRHAPGV